MKFLKSIPMFLLMAAPYLIIYVASLEETWLLSGGVWILLLFAVVIFNMFYPFILRKTGYTAKQLLFWDMLIKISHIPMFVVIFLGIALSIMLSFMMIPAVALFEYIIVLASSIYGVSGLGKARKEGTATGTYRIVMLVFHFFFCLDVVAAIWSYVNVRGEVKRQQMSGGTKTPPHGRPYQDPRAAQGAQNQDYQYPGQSTQSQDYQYPGQNAQGQSHQDPQSAQDEAPKDPDSGEK